MPKQPKTRNPTPSGRQQNQQKSRRQNKIPKQQSNEAPPTDKLVDFVDHFLDCWKGRYPNPKFWEDLLSFMTPFETLQKSQLMAVMADFGTAMGQQTDFFRFHIFGSTVTGLAFRGKLFFELLVIVQLLPNILFFPF